MTNPFFAAAGTPTDFTVARAAAIRAQFGAVEAGFDKVADRFYFVAAAGTPNALVATMTYPPVGYEEGMRLDVKIASTNTGPVTINVNGLGAVPVVGRTGAALVAGDLLLGSVESMYYTAGKFVIRAVSGARGPGFNQVAGAAADGITADQAAINAAFDLGDVHLDGSKTYGVSSPIFVPSGRTLWLNGASIIALAGFLAVDGVNGIIGSRLGTTRPNVMGPGQIDGAKIGVGGSFINGIMMYGTVGFNVGGGGRILVKNISGYGYWGVGAGVGQESSGTFHGIDCLNTKIHYEMTRANVRFEDMTSGDGDGDINCESWLHPLAGSRGIYKDFYGYGQCSAIIEMSNNETGAQDILLDNVKGVTTEGGIPVVCNGTAGGFLRINNCDMRSIGGTIGMNISATSGAISDSYIEGQIIGANIYGAGVEWDVRDSTVKSVSTGGINGSGINASAGAIVRVDDASHLWAESVAPGVPYTGDVRVGPGTRLTPYGGGFRKRIPNNSDQATNSAAGVVVSGYTDVRFNIAPGRTYEFTWEGNIACDVGTSSPILALHRAGGAIISSLSGSIALGIAPGEQHVEGITAAEGIGVAGSSVTTVPTSGAYLPARVRAVFTCTSTGTIELRVARGGASGSVYILGQHIARLEEV